MKLRNITTTLLTSSAVIFGACSLPMSMPDGTPTVKSSLNYRSAVRQSYPFTFSKSAKQPFARGRSALTSIGLNELHNLAADSMEGYLPYRSLVFGLDSNLYGTTRYGGKGNSGSFWKVTMVGDRTNPTATFTTLHHFAFNLANDGTYCEGKLAQDAYGYIYGTCIQGGSASYGTAYRINVSTGVVTLLHHFSDGSVTNDGQTPVGGLTTDGSGNFYGTTAGGGASGYGTIYRLYQGRNGWTCQILYSFTGGSNGYSPQSHLVLATDGNLYGTTNYGGANSEGVIFRYNLNTSTYTKLADPPAAGYGNSNVSMNPGVTQIPTAFTSGGRLEFWGVTTYGGTYDHGTVYKISETSVGSGTYNYTVVYNFNWGTNNPGFNPYSTLVFSTDIRGSYDAGGVLYGTTYYGGISSWNGSGTGSGGSIFRIDLSGNFSEPPNSTAWMGGYPDLAPTALVEGIVGGGGASYTPVLFGISNDGGTSLPSRTRTGFIWEVWLQ